MSTTDSNETHNPSDAACVKNGSGTPTRDVVCPICRPDGDENHSHDYNMKCYCGFVRQYSPRYSFIDWLVAIGVGREVAVRSVASHDAKESMRRIREFVNIRFTEGEHTDSNRKNLAAIIEAAQHPNHRGDTGADALNEWFLADAILASDWLEGVRREQREADAVIATRFVPFDPDEDKSGHAWAVHRTATDIAAAIRVGRE